VDLTFSVGIPSFFTLIVTSYGVGMVSGFYEDGSVDLYIGHGRTFNVPSETSWREARV
jgi:hypothetical protein